MMIDVARLTTAVSKFMVEAADEYADMTDGMWICHYGTERFAQCYVAHRLSKDFYIGSKPAAATVEQNIQADFCHDAFGSAEIKKQLVDSRYFRNNSDIDIVLWSREDGQLPVVAIELKSHENVETDMERLYHLLLTKNRPKNTLRAGVVGGYFYSKSGACPDELREVAGRWFKHQESKFGPRGVELTPGPILECKYTHDEYHGRPSVLSAYVIGMRPRQNLM